jgi:hypothetical protein
MCFLYCRFAPVQQVLHSSSSDISVLLSDSDEEIIQKQQDVCKTQGTVSIISGYLQVDIRIFTTAFCCVTAAPCCSSKLNLQIAYE